MSGFDDLSRATTRRGALKVFGGAAAAALGSVLVKPFRADAAACKPGLTECGPQCCPKGSTCTDASNGCCCPAGATPCGTSCCKRGVACIDSSRSLCGCPAGTTSCFTDNRLTCCPAGTACSADSGSCPELWQSSYVGGTCSCFTGATVIAMADGSSKRISDVVLGDRVVGIYGQPNLVLEIERPVLGARALYALNGGDHFVTAEHPIMTTGGWKSIDPAATALEVPSLRVDALRTGDVVLHSRSAHSTGGDSGALLTRLELEQLRLDRVTSISADAATPLYNLRLDGDHTYVANGFVVHNK
ncbi:MAG: hypothetical protein JWP02_511 [Acidimicrobiales bacterium]|nr:hypothetical protein [Acidimicrobiales bacterium]